MKSFLLFIILGLQGCSAYFEHSNIVENCYEPFTTQISSLFQLRPREIVYLQPFYGANKATRFFEKHDFKGYVLAAENFGDKDPLSETTDVVFTGNIIKRWPSFLGYHIGGNRKNASFEVIINKSKYVYYGFYEYQALMNSLPKNCRFDSP